MMTAHHQKKIIPIRQQKPKTKTLASETKSGTFIGVRLTDKSCEKVIDYAESIGLPSKDILSPKDLHVSVIYSKNLFPIIPYPVVDACGAEMHVYDVVKIGKAIALIGESEWLRSRVRLARALGLRSSFPGYIPHVSLMYDPPKNFYVDDIIKPKFTIRLGQEYIEDLK